MNTFIRFVAIICFVGLSVAIVYSAYSGYNIYLVLLLALGGGSLVGTIMRRTTPNEVVADIENEVIPDQVLYEADDS